MSMKGRRERNNGSGCVGGMATALMLIREILGMRPEIPG